MSLYPLQFGKALKSFFFLLQREFGFTMNMLDIGGGFTGTEFQLEEVNFVQWVDILD